MPTKPITYSIVFERIEDDSLPPGYYYAHIPSLNLTTHGKGLEGARAAALDLLRLWVEEKRENNETLPVEIETYFSKVTLEDAILPA
jgi:predicted RNase H-like HicB family nuclease